MRPRDLRAATTQKITGVCTEVSSRPVIFPAMAKGDAERRGPGRPRKWADEAERKRAYRARLAEDMAEPARLRAELREARASIRRLERELDRTDRGLTRAKAALANEKGARVRLEEQARLLGEQVRFWQRRAGFEL